LHTGPGWGSTLRISKEVDRRFCSSRFTDERRGSGEWRAWTKKHGYPMPVRPSKQPQYPNADYMDNLNEFIDQTTRALRSSRETAAPPGRRSLRS